LAAISGRSFQAEYDRLLDGVSSRFDAVQAQRSVDPIDRLRTLIERLPAEKRATLVEALERHAMEALKALGKKGA
jgi:hypothetical protein